MIDNLKKDLCFHDWDGGRNVRSIMNRQELYRQAGFGAASILQVLRANYTNYVCDEMTKIMGHADADIAEIVLENVYSRLSEIDVDCQIEFLVFDCLRKELLDRCRRTANLRCSAKNLTLREAEISDFHSEKDDLRLDIVLLFLSIKERRYFLDRYYFLRDDIKFNARYEKTIYRLFNGKGIAAIRFRYFGIPSKTITSKRYVDYLDHLDLSCLGKILSNKTAITNRATGMPALYSIAERQYSIARYSAPISLIIVLILFVICALLR